MKPLENRPNLEGWTLDSLDEAKDILEGIVRKVAAEAIEYALKDEMTSISFPVEWDEDPCDKDDIGSDGHGGRFTKDPLTMHLSIALDCGDENSPVYEFNLREALKDSLSDCISDGYCSYGLGRLSDSLRILADEIDAARRSAPRQ